MDQKQPLHWEPLMIALGIAALFAVAAVGYFFAVYTHSGATAADSSAPKALVPSGPTEAERKSTLDSLAASSRPASASSTLAGMASSTIAASTTDSGPSETERRRVLDSLNAQ